MVEFKFQRGSATNEICEAVRREILTLEMEPGAPLDETTLSRRFNVSRSPIREVLSRLAAEGLVETLPNRGAIVAPIDLVNFSSFIEALDLQQRYATRLAARHRTAADLVWLKELAGDYSTAVKNRDRFGILQSNYDFHKAIGEVGRNPYVSRHYGQLLSEARRFLHIHIRFLEATSDENKLADQHDDFIEAIEAQDVMAADRVAHEHTFQFHDRFLKALRYEADADFSIEVAAGLGSRKKKPVVA
ncbi:GntR family transcriptional regulator [Pelagibius litoralis]|uniref:GntR family transcriptional regulator n=1 Tax=Pelagibius litoralis TaxID=374515 RepID=A0A967F1G5_9PROT|nr:GntR family transcriptional regulator [Pelagibius litoralis]NIA71330.1 GntR family transcriptional regulator [Pelagibius litoralis]